MPIFARTNGNAVAGSGLGITTQIASFTKAGLTQAELDTVCANIALTNTVAGISAFGNTVHVAVQGPGINTDVLTNYAGTTGVTAAVVTTIQSTPI